jgi:tetratricopeptide (TPR) repeat protein
VRFTLLLLVVLSSACGGSNESGGYREICGTGAAIEAHRKDVRARCSVSLLDPTAEDAGESVALLAPRSSSAPDPRSVEARNHYERAVALEADNDDKLAAIHYARAYEVSPVPKILAKLGAAYARVGDDARAYEAYATFLANPGEAPASLVDTVRSRLAELEERTVTLLVSCDAAAEKVQLDDLPEITCPARVRVRLRPGRVVVGTCAERRELVIERGKALAVNVGAPRG